MNEFRFNYNREGQQTFQHPANTELVQNSCPPAPTGLPVSPARPPCFYGDVPQATSYGIHPFLGANREGLPFISVSGGFSIWATIRKASFLKPEILSSGRTT